MQTIRFVSCTCQDKHHGHLVTTAGERAVAMAFFSYAAVELWLLWQEEFAVDAATILAAARTANLPAEITANDLLEAIAYVHSLLESIDEPSPAPQPTVH